jgi:hypothetical protein
MPWWCRAACKDMPIRLFFSVVPEDRKVALAACKRCLVVTECFDAAMAEEHGEDERFGIRGGLLPWRRTALAAVELAQ